MFEIQYKIVSADNDDYVGENGFLQIRAGDFAFGEIWSDELDDIMPTESLCDWMERLVRVCKYLETEDYIALSIVDFFDDWLEFRREGETVFVGEIHAPKKVGTMDIEREQLQVTSCEWKDQPVSYKELCDEVYRKAGEYIRYLKENNEDEDGFECLLNEYEVIRTIESKAFSDEVLQGIVHKGEELLHMRAVAFRYKQLGMSAQEMIDNLELLRKEVDSEEEEDLILVLMDQIGGCCHSDLRIF